MEQIEPQLESQRPGPNTIAEFVSKDHPSWIEACSLKYSPGKLPDARCRVMRHAFLVDPLYATIFATRWNCDWENFLRTACARAGLQGGTRSLAHRVSCRHVQLDRATHSSRLLYPPRSCLQRRLLRRLEQRAHLLRAALDLRLRVPRRSRAPGCASQMTRDGVGL